MGCLYSKHNPQSKDESIGSRQDICTLLNECTGRLCDNKVRKENNKLSDLLDIVKRFLMTTVALQMEFETTYIDSTTRVTTKISTQTKRIAYGSKYLIANGSQLTLQDLTTENSSNSIFTITLTLAEDVPSSTPATGGRVTNVDFLSVFQFNCNYVQADSGKTTLTLAAESSNANLQTFVQKETDKGYYYFKTSVGDNYWKVDQHCSLTLSSAINDAGHFEFRPGTDNVISMCSKCECT